MRLSIWLSLTVVAALVITGAARAGVGGVLHHFNMSGNIFPVAAGVYRDDAYVFGTFFTGNGGELRRYTSAGSLINSFPLAGAVAPLDPGPSPRGSNYITVLDAGTALRTYETATGSFISSVAVPTSSGYAYVPGGEYIYLAASPYVHRYTTAGSHISSFNVGDDAGTLAATPYFDSLAAEYVIVLPASRGVHPALVYTGDGSFVSSFTFSGPYPDMDYRLGASVGEGYPSSAGPTLWLTLQTDFIWRSAYEIDLGNGRIAVAPASLGRIKALFK